MHIWAESINSCVQTCLPNSHGNIKIVPRGDVPNYLSWTHSKVIKLKASPAPFQKYSRIRSYILLKKKRQEQKGGKWRVEGRGRRGSNERGGEGRGEEGEGGKQRAEWGEERGVYQKHLYKSWISKSLGCQKPQWMHCMHIYLGLPAYQPHGNWWKHKVQAVCYATSNKLSKPFELIVSLLDKSMEMG